MKRKYLTRFLGAVLMIAIGLGLSEVLLRVYNSYSPSFIFYDQSYNRFRGKPFSELYGSKLNSRGFNDAEFQPKKKGVFRIVALGDSFAFGVVPRENNYLKLVEKQLQDKGYNVEVLNMGIPQTGPQDYVSVLANEGLQLNPDLVLVSFFMGNDFTTLTTNKEDKPEEYSYVASLLRYVFFIRPSLYQGTDFSADVYDDNRPAFNQNAFIKVEEGESYVFILAGARKTYPVFEDIRGKVMAQLGALKTLSEKNGAKIAFVVIPEQMQIDPALREEIQKANVNDDKYSGEYDFSYPNTALAEWFRENNVPFLDLYKPFQEAHDRGLKLYKPNDIHWNIAGNKLAAEELEKYLEETINFPVIK